MGLGRRFDELRQRYDRRVSLIGWSLGGVYARELARRFPSDVRQVITLASPFRDLEAHNVRSFLLARRRRHSDESAFREQLRAPLPVPTTAIVSRTDGITPWQSCIAEPGPCSESLKVESSHVGMTLVPCVLGSGAGGPSPARMAIARRSRPSLLQEPSFVGRGERPLPCGSTGPKAGAGGLMNVELR